MAVAEIARVVDWETAVPLFYLDPLFSVLSSRHCASRMLSELLIKHTCGSHANDIGILKYLKVFHVFDVLQSLSTRFKLFLEKRDSLAVPIAHILKPTSVQTPAIVDA